MRASHRLASVAFIAALLCGGCSGEEGTPHSLYTHCGIDELRFEGEWYERVDGPLDDGSGNPPAGWDNPEQQGAIERIDETTVVFTDDSGHREEFTLRPGADGPKKVCA